LTFTELTREAAADPRVFVRLAEVADESGSSHLSGISALDSQRILDVLDEVCFTLTHRPIRQANALDASPVETLRKAMKAGREEVLAVSLAMATVDAHWQTVQERFGDAPPAIPDRDAVVSPDAEADERLMKKAEGFLDRLIGLVNDMMRAPAKALDAKRELERLRHACLTFTGQELGDVADRWTSPLRRFRGPLQHPAVELIELREAYHELPEVTPEEAALWDGVIETAIELQWRARHDPAKFMAYVFRDADPSRAGETLELEWFHVSWFGVWLDPRRPHSEIFAPPGHGKSYCVCAMDVWEAARHPELRFLVLYDKGDEKVAKEIMRVEGIMQSDLFRAVFPEIRVLDRSGLVEVETPLGKKRAAERKKRHQKTQSAFTIGRKNDLFSREATFEGAGILGNINGDGFDRIRGDDYSSPQCREEPYQRERIAKRFNNVAQERLRDPADSRIRIIHTPWHPEDSPGRIRKAGEAGKLPKWRIQIDPYAIKDGPDGKAIPLWPRKKDSDFLEERKFTLGRDYDCVYRLQAAEPAKRPISTVRWYNSVPAGGGEDDPSDLALWDSLATAHRTLSIDPAGSDARTASDTGVIDGRLVRDPDTDSHYGFVTNVWFLHLASPKLLDWIVARLMHAWEVEKHPYNDLMIESTGGIKGQVSLYQDWLPKEFERLGMPESARPSILTPGVRLGEGQTGQNRGKLRRLREASTYIERGSVRLAGLRQIEIAPGSGELRPALRPIPNSDLDVLAKMMLDFDGTTRFDAGDALTQWILYHRAKLRDPFANLQLGRPEVGPVRGPFASAFYALQQKMLTKKNEYVSPDDAVRRTFGKYDMEALQRTN
jgi:hypothetical protein